MHYSYLENIYIKNELINALTCTESDCSCHLLSVLAGFIVILKA